MQHHVFEWGSAHVLTTGHGSQVLIQMERSDDLQMIAGRETIRFAYEVAYDPSSGRVDSLNLNMAIDTGWFFGACGVCLQAVCCMLGVAVSRAEAYIRQCACVWLWVWMCMRMGVRVCVCTCTRATG